MKPSGQGDIRRKTHPARSDDGRPPNAGLTHQNTGEHFNAQRPTPNFQSKQRFAFRFCPWALGVGRWALIPPPGGFLLARSIFSSEQRVIFVRQHYAKCAPQRRADWQTEAMHLRSIAIQAEEFLRRFNEDEAVWRCYEHKRRLRKLLGSRCPLTEETLDLLDWQAAERECRAHASK